MIITSFSDEVKMEVLLWSGMPLGCPIDGCEQVALKYIVAVAFLINFNHPDSANLLLDLAGFLFLRSKTIHVYALIT